jgi:hypothetical protein
MSIVGGSSDVSGSATSVPARKKVPAVVFDIDGVFKVCSACLPSSLYMPG